MLNVPIVHIEARLRSYNLTMPEETNRMLTDRVSRLLFCPTQAAALNLAIENILAGVHVVGDEMIDALMEKGMRGRLDILRVFKLEARKYFLATIHRASNTDDADALKNILGAFCWWLKRDYAALFGGLPERTTLARQLRMQQYHADRLLADLGLLDVVDSAPIELLFPIRDGRSKLQLGKKNRDNTRASIG